MRYYSRAIATIAAIDEGFKGVAGTLRDATSISDWLQVPGAHTLSLTVELLWRVAWVTRRWVGNTAFVDAMIAGRTGWLGLRVKKQFSEA